MIELNSYNGLLEHRQHQVINVILMMVEVVAKVMQEFISKSFFQDFILLRMDILMRFFPQSSTEVEKRYQIRSTNA